MKKFNRKFNNTFSRFSFWITLESHFAGFEKLLKPLDVLTVEDRKILRELHKTLRECYTNVKSRSEFHLENMKNLQRRNCKNGTEKH